MLSEPTRGAEGVEASDRQVDDSQGADYGKDLTIIIIMIIMIIIIIIIINQRSRRS